MPLDPRIAAPHRLFFRVPFLVPSWGPEEMAMVRRALMGRQPPADASDRLEEALRDAGFRHTVLTSSGRFAIEIALRSLARPGGEVIIPAFGCRAVAAAVVAAGCTPVVADINADLTISAESIAQNVTSRTVAVLVAHLSGKPAADLDAIVTFCRERSIPLIDDAAQALGVSWQSRPLGTFGDFGILSFGVGKPTFSLGGGALVAGSRQRLRACEQLAAGLAPPRLTGRRRMASFLLQYRWRRATLPFFAAARLAGRALHLPAGAFPRGAMTPLEAELQVMQLRRLASIIGAYRRNASRVLDAIHDSREVEAPQASDASGCTKLILRTRGPATALAAFMSKRGIETEWSYRPLDLDPDFARYARQPCARARQVWRELLAVPVHAALTDAQIARVASAARSFAGSLPEADGALAR